MARLASLAGVSVSTVSKAFSGSAEISEERREYIFKIAKENGCYDKYCKSNFKKYVIAVICPEFQSSYYSLHLSFMEKEIKKRGGIMVVCSHNFEKSTTSELISYFTECVKVDGLIVYDSSVPQAKYTTPVVVIGHNDFFDCISLSLKKATCDAVKYFVENGHKDIAFIGETLTLGKYAAFLHAMAENNCEIKREYIIETKERFELSGYIAMNSLLSLEKPPTAVFAAYDNIAVGAMKSIYEHGLKIPDDISIIGMDDNKDNDYLDVPLTSITLYNEDLSEIVVDVLFERIKNGSIGKVKKIHVSAELVKRGSVGKSKNV